jgi:hypothetical protein
MVADPGRLSKMAAIVTKNRFFLIRAPDNFQV